MKPKYMLLCLVLMLSFSVSVSASSNESSVQTEIGVVEKLLIRLVDGEQIGALDNNGTDVRDQLKQLHNDGLSVQELFQIIVDDSLVLVDMTVPASITPSLRFPKVYYPYENLLTPHLWWNGIVQ